LQATNRKGERARVEVEEEQEEKQWGREEQE
jgi:hypothetical protein